MMLPSLSFKIRPEDAVAISIKNVYRVFYKIEPSNDAGS
jgi:hypothetical protein